MTAAIGIETFIVSGLPQAAAAPSRRCRGEQRRAARSRRARRPARGCAPRAGRAACARGGRSRAGARPRRGPPARRPRRPRRGRRPPRPAPGPARAGAAHASDVPRITGPQPRMPGRDGALERAGVGGERHPRGDVRRHHPVLGDRDEQQVEEVALVRGRLLAAQQQVEVLREAQPPHQVAAEVAAAHLDPVRIGLADVADRAGVGVHAAATLRAAPAAVKTAISWPR